MFMRTRLNVMSIHPLLFLLINVFTHEHTKRGDDSYSAGPSSNLFLKTDTDDDHGFPQSFPNSRLRFGQWTSWTWPHDRDVRSSSALPRFSFQDFQPTVTTSPFAQESTTTTTFSSIFPPWQQQQSRDDSILSVGSSLQSPTSDKSVASSTITSTLDRRLVQSQSAPAAGLSALAAGGPSNIKLPRAQNPTITLLQKARGTWQGKRKRSVSSLWEL